MTRNEKEIRKMEFQPFLNKDVEIYRQGAMPNFKGKASKIQFYRFIDLIGMEVKDPHGQKMLVFNINHIKLIK